MSKLPMIMLGLATAVVLPVVSLNSCANLLGAATNLPEPIGGMARKNLAARQKLLEEYREPLALILEGKAMVLEACGMDKDAQKLKFHANVLRQSSSSADLQKNITIGSELNMEASNKISAGKNLQIKSKQLFVSGINKKNQAYPRLQAKIAKYALETALYIKAVKDTGDKKGYLIVAADVDKAFTLFNTYNNMAKAEDAFNQAASNYGKQYSFPVPMSKAPKLDLAPLTKELKSGIASGAANKKATGGAGGLMQGLQPF